MFYGREGNRKSGVALVTDRRFVRLRAESLSNSLVLCAIIACNSCRVLELLHNYFRRGFMRNYCMQFLHATCCNNCKHPHMLECLQLHMKPRGKGDWVQPTLLYGVRRSLPLLYVPDRAVGLACICVCLSVCPNNIV